MTIASAPLYTPAILGLATALANYPLAGDWAVRGSARSRSCGSTLDLGLAWGEDGAITRVGIAASACAIGQASIALFARGAQGRPIADLPTLREAFAAWLAGEAGMPDWPDTALLEPARAYPARHGAILLPWDASVDALGKGVLAG